MALQVAILDQQNQKLPTGKIGEVCINGPNVTKGYLNRPEANQEAFAGAVEHRHVMPVLLAAVAVISYAQGVQLPFRSAVQAYNRGLCGCHLVLQELPQHADSQACAGFP